MFKKDSIDEKESKKSASLTADITSTNREIEKDIVVDSKPTKSSSHTNLSNIKITVIQKSNSNHDSINSPDESVKNSNKSTSNLNLNLNLISNDPSSDSNNSSSSPKKTKRRVYLKKELAFGTSSITTPTTTTPTKVNIQVPAQSEIIKPTVAAPANPARQESSETNANDDILDISINEKDNAINL